MRKMNPRLLLFINHIYNFRVFLNQSVDINSTDPLSFPI